MEESIYVKEMKEAVKIEKSILRFRLTLIRNWALAKLKDLRTKSLTVYHKLDDWIHVASKAENDAIDEMVNYIPLSNSLCLVHYHQESHRGRDQDPERVED